LLIVQPLVRIGAMVQQVKNNVKLILMARNSKRVSS